MKLAESTATVAMRSSCTRTYTSSRERVARFLRARDVRLWRESDRLKKEGERFNPSASP